MLSNESYKVNEVSVQISCLEVGSRKTQKKNQNKSRTHNKGTQCETTYHPMNKRHQFNKRLAKAKVTLKQILQSCVTNFKPSRQPIP